MSYEVIIHPGALREFDKLPKTAQKRVAEAINALANEPRPPGAVKLADAEAYRFRVGTYRIAYAVKDERLVVLVVKVAHRRDIYSHIETIRRRVSSHG